MDRPSRSKMLQHKPKCTPQPQKHGDYKIEDIYKDVPEKKAELAIKSSTVTREFVERFCSKHGLTLKEEGEYYYLS